MKSLAKRTSAYYNTCKNKGSGLIYATGYSDATALIKFDRSIVATALTRDQLTACGWTIDQNPYTGLAENFVQYVGQTMLNELGISPSNNVVVNWEHTVAVDSTHPVNSLAPFPFYFSILLDLPESNPQGDKHTNQISRPRAPTTSAGTIPPTTP